MGVELIELIDGEIVVRPYRSEDIEILAATGNGASQRVAEKAGAIKETVLRKRLLLHGEPVEGVLYSLVGEDFS